MSTPRHFLQILAGPSTSKLFPLSDPETTIGRSKDNHVVIGGPAVSRHHATIYFAGHHALIEDMGSSYGTLFNGTRLEHFVLQEFLPEDQIVLGNIPVRLVAVTEDGKPDLEPLPEFDEPLTATGPDSVITDFETETVECKACGADNYETDFLCIECGAKMF